MIYSYPFSLTDIILLHNYKKGKAVKEKILWNRYYIANYLTTNLLLAIVK